MTIRSRSAVRIAVICGFVLLALSVFAWGLHAKLSLYGHDGTPSTATVAKLLPGERTGRILVGSPQPQAAWQTALCLLAALLVLRPLKRSWLETSRLKRRAQAPPVASPRFSRPPPVPSRAC